MTFFNNPYIIKTTQRYINALLNKNVILSYTNFPVLCEINKFVQEGFYYSAGKIRTVPVSIGGTKWTYELPIESIIKEELEDRFNKKISDIDKAIEILLYITITTNRQTIVCRLVY